MASPKTRLLATACAGLLAAGLTVGTVGTAQAAPSYDGFDGPRGLSIGKTGKTVVSEANGAITRVFRRTDRQRRIAKLPAEFLAPAVAVSPDNAVWALTVGGESDTSAKLYLIKPGKNRRLVANISRWAKNHPDPFDLENHPKESNPYGVAAGPQGSALVADAAANAVLQVRRNGNIKMIARVKPRTVKVPEQLQEEGLPPRMKTEAVTTSVTMGRDGSVYIGELRGFPATPGTSEIWRVRPGAHHAVCRPHRPNRGNCQRAADGFTSIVSLDAGRGGSLYVAELSKMSWLAMEADPPIEGAEIGSVIRVGHDRNVRHELGAGKVIMPGSVAVGPRGGVWVSGPIFGPGSIMRLN